MSRRRIISADRPLALVDAERLATSIIRSGVVAFSQHAREEMAKDNLSDRDVINVIRGGQCEGCDFERGSWRYRIRTPRIVVPVVFRSDAEMVVVTAWRVNA